MFNSKKVEDLTIGDFSKETKDRINTMLRKADIDVKTHLYGHIRLCSPKVDDQDNQLVISDFKSTNFILSPGDKIIMDDGRFMEIVSKDRIFYSTSRIDHRNYASFVR